MIGFTVLPGLFGAERHHILALVEDTAGARLPLPPMVPQTLIKSEVEDPWTILVTLPIFLVES